MVICAAFVGGLKNLTIGAYAPLTGPCWGGGFAVKNAMELALSQVNERTDILPEYQLHMVLNDTKVYTVSQESHFATTPHWLGETGWAGIVALPCGTVLGDKFCPSFLCNIVTAKKIKKPLNSPMVHFEKHRPSL